MAERRSPLYKPFLLDAIRAGDTTMTRRVCKWPFEWRATPSGDRYMRSLDGKDHSAPGGDVGVIWALCEPLHKAFGSTRLMWPDGPHVVDRRTGKHAWDWPWKRDTLASMFMPQWAARDFVTVTDVRAERLQDTSEADAIAEGAFGISSDMMQQAARLASANGRSSVGPVDYFSQLWDSINGKKHPWASNPFVWVYTFGDYQRDPGRAMT